MNSLHILIIEDNLIEANDIRLTLEQAGHTITTIARNYSEAIRSARQFTPDLALIDIKLEGSSADGISTAQELQKQYALPVLYLTASSEYETFRRAKKTQPAAYLLKPFRHTELALQVELAYHNYRVNRAEIALTTQENALFLYINEGYERVSKKDIVFLEADGAYAKIYLADPPTSHFLSVNIGYLEQYLPTPNFHRLSRSLLINLDYLERVTNETIVLKYARVELLKRITLVKNRKSGSGLAR